MNNFNNLNNLSECIYAKYKPKPKKITSVFHIHPPYLKLEQLRVELDNRASDFTDKDNPVMKWKSVLHKGSGKKAKKMEYSNDELKKDDYLLFKSFSPIL